MPGVADYRKDRHKATRPGEKLGIGNKVEPDHISICLSIPSHAFQTSKCRRSLPHLNNDGSASHSALFATGIKPAVGTEQDHRIRRKMRDSTVSEGAYKRGKAV